MPSRPPKGPRPPKPPAAPRAKSPSAIARDQRRAANFAAATGKPQAVRPKPGKSAEGARAARPDRAAAKPRPPRSQSDAPRPVKAESPRPPRVADAPAPSRRGAGRTVRAPAPAPSPIAAPGAGERIAKLLARAGIASRREIERMIAERRIAIDGVAVATPATVLKGLNGVTVDGKAVAAAEPTRLFAFHKPPGFLTAERDPKGRPTIYDRLPAGLPRLVPVGRLDLNTEGLLLLTTDGGLKRKLELPATGVERSYRARVFGEVSQAQLEELIEGIEIEGVRYGSIDANLERRTGRNGWVQMRLKEGKNREVRRVLEHLGLQVSRLIRVAYGPFLLGDLPAGAVYEVAPRELAAFAKTLK